MSENPYETRLLNAIDGLVTGTNGGANYHADKIAELGVGNFQLAKTAQDRLADAFSSAMRGDAAQLGLTHLTAIMRTRVALATHWGKAVVGGDKGVQHLVDDVASFGELSGMGEPSGHNRDLAKGWVFDLTPLR